MVRVRQRRMGGRDASPSPGRSTASRSSVAKSRLWAASTTRACRLPRRLGMTSRVGASSPAICRIGASSTVSGLTLLRVVNQRSLWASTSQTLAVARIRWAKRLSLVVTTSTRRQLLP